MPRLGLFRDMRLRSKLLLVYSLVLMVSVGASGLVIYRVLRQAIETSATAQLRNTVTTICDMVETSANVSIRNHLRAIAEKNRELVQSRYDLYREGKLTESEARMEASRLLRSQTIGETGYLYCVDSTGVTHVHPRAALVGQNVSTLDFIQKQLVRKEGYLEYEWGSPGESETRPKALYMTYFEPWDWIISASSYREEFKTLVNVGDFQDSVLSLRFHESGYPFVVDLQGNLVIHPKRGANIFEMVDDDGHQVMQEMCKKRNGSTSFRWFDPVQERWRHELVIYRYLPSFDWIVAASGYYDEMYQPLVSIRHVLVVSFLLTLTAILACTVWLSKLFVRPLDNLEAGFHQGAGGDYSTRLPVESNDELGRLANYFNTFMQRLEENTDALQEEIHERRMAEEELARHRDHLEDLVSARTSELEQAQAALKASERQLADVIEYLPDPTLAIDIEGRVLVWNRAMEELTGVAPAQMVGKTGFEYALPFYGERRPMLIDLVLLPNEERERLYPFTQRHGDILLTEVYTETFRGGAHLWGMARPLYDASGQVVGAIESIRDITARKRAEEELTKHRQRLQELVEERTSELTQANKQLRLEIMERERLEDELRLLSSLDGLTGIANRRVFDETIVREWQRCARSGEHLSIIMLDIDYFKHFNDHYGHQAGDEALKRVAQTLRCVLNRPADLLARYGGEEFAAILPETRCAGAREVAARMRQAVEELDVAHDGVPTEPVLTISVGVVTVYPSLALLPETAIGLADQALYKAKQEGRNRLVVSDQSVDTIS